MPDVKYLIVGAGMAADGAVRGIRDLDPDGSIVVVGPESDPPYKRPMLSKGLWTGAPLEKVWSNTEKKGADIRLGRTITAIDPDTHAATDDQGETWRYEKLLLATGSSPRDPGIGNGDVINFRSLEDYRRLRSVAENGQRIGVIGGGFIGSELAASLTTNGKDVTMIFPEETISSRVLPPELGKYMTDYYREKGVNILNGYKVASMTKQGDELALEAKSDAGDQDRDIMVDGVVAGIGAEPNTGLAKKAGLDIDNGVVVNEHLRTSHADIYAAGDIAAFWQPALGGRRRVEHEDNAKKTGRVAGKNMAGADEVYDYLPLFYSDLFDMGYEAVGDVDTRNEIFADWAEPNRKGVIYFLAEGKVRGVLLWNVWEQVDAARELIKAGAQVTEKDLRGRIPMGE
jgi:3-phenylpropionate/trans-cinnamate dioxygenase ferredoxin reductase component